jgi:DICT domain-containing protein
VRTERKSAVLALSRYLEAQATEATDPPMVLAATQRAEFFGGATREIYQRMAASSPLVAVFGQGLPEDLGSGVRGIALADGDPLNTQWIVLTLGANVAAALLARERTDNGSRPDRDRLFDVAITNDRSLVTIAARHLLSRMP